MLRIAYKNTKCEFWNENVSTIEKEKIELKNKLYEAFCLFENVETTKKELLLSSKSKDYVKKQVEYAQQLVLYSSKVSIGSMFASPFSKWSSFLNVSEDDRVRAETYFLMNLY